MRFRCASVYGAAAKKNSPPAMSSNKTNTPVTFLSIAYLEGTELCCIANVRKF